MPEKTEDLIFLDGQTQVVHCLKVAKFLCQIY